jgi:Tol biopolymer transport system component
VGNLYTRAVGIVADDRLLFKDGAAKILTDWSHDGKYLAYVAGGDVWALPVSDESSEIKPLRVTETSFMESNARISPDSRWVAYQSNETGQEEIYIQSFPKPGFKQQISTSGGMQPRWSYDGKELYYFTIENAYVVMAVAVKSAGNSLEVGAPTALIPGAYGTRIFSVSADGRFLLQVVPGASAARSLLASLSSIPVPNHIVVLRNWTNRK